jgi:ketosteroid isomerase-like protein
MQFSEAFTLWWAQIQACSRVGALLVEIRRKEIDNPTACNYKVGIQRLTNNPDNPCSLNFTLERNDTMRKKLHLVFFALLAAATLCNAQTDPASKAKPNTATVSSGDQAIVSKSKETWEAYKSKNIPAIKELTAEDYVAHTLAGPSNLQKDIATIDKLTIEAYTLDEPKVSMASKDVAILRYKCVLKGSYDGKAFSPVYATEVWVNRGGKWQIVSYTETPMN